MGDLQRTFSAGGHTLLAARALIADDSVSGRASITDLASDTQAEDFHVVELNQSGAIVAHFTHPEHCAMIVGAGARPFAAPPLHALALTACLPPVPFLGPAELRQKQQQQSQRMGEHLGRQSAKRWKCAPSARPPRAPAHGLTPRRFFAPSLQHGQPGQREGDPRCVRDGEVREREEHGHPL